MAVLLVTGAVFFGCSSRTKAGRFECSEFTKPFFWQPPEVQKSKFLEYDLETQYALFICGNQVIHPPTIYLAEPFARQGPKLVSFLEGKLTTAGDDLTIRDIILVFEEMHRQRTYNVYRDDRLMQLMATRVKGMKDPGWQDTCLRSLQEIQK